MRRVIKCCERKCTHIRVCVHLFALSPIFDLLNLMIDATHQTHFRNNRNEEGGGEGVRGGVERGASTYVASIS